MWAKEQQIVEGIRDHHHNAVRLPSVEKLPDNMTATGDRAEDEHLGQLYAQL